MKHSLFGEKHEISMSQMSITVLAAWQPERKGPSDGRAGLEEKELSSHFYVLFFFLLIFRSCHGKLVATPGTQTAATPTTASQTPQTSPVLWWSSGSKLHSWVSLDCFAVTKLKPIRSCPLSWRIWGQIGQYAWEFNPVTQNLLKDIRIAKTCARAKKICSKRRKNVIMHRNMILLDCGVFEKL